MPQHYENTFRITAILFCRIFKISAYLISTGNSCCYRWNGTRRASGNQWYCWSTRTKGTTRKACSWWNWRSWSKRITWTNWKNRSTRRKRLFPNHSLPLFTDPCSSLFLLWDNPDKTHRTTFICFTFYVKLLFYCCLYTGKTERYRTWEMPQ